MADPVPLILLVRLKPRLPDGSAVGASRRVCHLVPVPESHTVPAVLRAYCGIEITPGSVELVDGMPCEQCMAKSPFPAFAMLHMLAPHHLTTTFADLASDLTVISELDQAIEPGCDGQTPETVCDTRKG